MLRDAGDLRDLLPLRAHSLAQHAQTPALPVFAPDRALTRPSRLRAIPKSPACQVPCFVKIKKICEFGIDTNRGIRGGFGAGRAR